jgi:hypothetical protein
MLWKCGERQHDVQLLETNSGGDPVKVIELVQWLFEQDVLAIISNLDWQF